MSYLPCLNPHCSSGGRPHPNCRCYADGGCVGPHAPDCEYFDIGGDVAAAPGMAVEHAVASHGLHALLTKSGHGEEAIHRHYKAAKQGHKSIARHARLDGEQIVAPDTSRLADALQDLHQQPDRMLGLGGSMADTHPEHAAQLAATATTSVQYLQSMKPEPTQRAPLDTIGKPEPMAEARYKRQLANAEHPMLVFQHIRDGKVLPADIQTISTLYPKLAQSMRMGAMEMLAKAKADGKTIPYRQKQGLSMLLGQPLDSTLIPQSMQAIMAAQGPQQTKQQSSTPRKASGPELSTIQKVNKLSQTPLEARLANRNER